MKGNFMTNELMQEFEQFIERRLDDKVRYRVELLREEYIPIKGNVMASGDAEFDAECERKVIAQLERGNLWAWCCIRVVAYIEGIDLEGDDYLGACSYESEEDFKKDGYYADMCDRARDELMAKIADVKNL